MTLAVLQDIKKAEADLEKKKAHAQKKADDIIKRAHQKVADIHAKAQENIAARKAKQDEQLTALFEKERRHNKDKISSDVSKIEASAKQHHKEAIDKITSSFFS